MDYYYYTTKNSNLFEFSFYRLNYNLLWIEGLADYQVSFYWVEPKEAVFLQVNILRWVFLN